MEHYGTLPINGTTINGTLQQYICFLHALVYLRNGTSALTSLKNFKLTFCKTHIE